MNRRELIKVLGGGIAGIPAVESIKRVDANADDVIVMKFPADVSENELSRSNEVLRKIFPNNQVLILYGNVTIEVMRRASHTS